MKLIDNFRKATAVDCDQIAQLVNSAYRPIESAIKGWTHESDLISGDRIDPLKIAQLLLESNSVVLLGIVEKKIIACVHIHMVNDSSYIGMLAVSPAMQGVGVGKQILFYAENYSARHCGARRCVLKVISQRIELIDFYRRCGYSRTGHRNEYPLSANAGFPKRDNLSVEDLEKHLFRSLSFDSLGC